MHPLFLTFVKLAGIAAFIAITNDGIIDRIELLVHQERIFTMVMYVGVWAGCIAALLIAAFQPGRWARWFWALFFAVVSFVGYSYIRIAGTELSVFDVISLWNSRQESGRAFEFYADQVVIAAIVALFGFLCIALQPPFLHRWIDKAARALSFAPIVPVLCMVGIIFMKAGGGTHALPQQFSPAAMGVVFVAKQIVDDLPEREKLTASPAYKPVVKNLVMIVDESIRPDYISLEPGNESTPYLASQRNVIADFGRAASGNNCSHYSNAILRLGGSRKNLIDNVTTSPSIWAYAKKAGYRTVYINAAAPGNSNSGELHNFMTLKEKALIDEFRTIDQSSPEHMDIKMARLVGEILARPEPHFIYANKNGAHFPYDNSYPQAEAHFKPTMSTGKAGAEQESRLNSYRNSVRWGVDGFFKTFMDHVDLTQATVLYTSDHGQNLAPGGITHCTTNNPHPREGLVPIMAMTARPDLLDRFRAAARINRDKSSHFALFPTALELMGYDVIAVESRYGSSLFGEATEPPAFTSGDIFGIFSRDLRWTPLDTQAIYREDIEVGPAQGEPAIRIPKTRLREAAHHAVQ